MEIGECYISGNIWVFFRRTRRREESHGNGLFMYTSDYAKACTTDERVNSKMGNIFFN